MQGYFLTGTDTDIGKTYAALRLMRHWQQQGQRVLAMKPVAAGCTYDESGQWCNDDVERLVSVTGQQDIGLMCPYHFDPFVSPHIAAAQVGVSIDAGRIEANYRELATQADVVLVEGAGGWLVPLGPELTIETLAQRLGLPVILVVGMRLGCINHALLTVRAIEQSGLPLAGWVANQVVPQQAAYAENLATLKAAIAAPLMLEIPYGT